MSIEIKKDNFLWITPSTSGNLLLGNKTEEEIKKENDNFSKNRLVEDSTNP